MQRADPGGPVRVTFTSVPALALDSERAERGTRAPARKSRHSTQPMSLSIGCTVLSCCSILYSALMRLYAVIFVHQKAKTFLLPIN